MNSNQGKLCGREHVLNELIPILAFTLLMALVVQFDTDEGPRRLWMAKKEINVLAINPIPIGSELAWILRFHLKQVAQPYLGANECLVRNCRT